MSLERNFYREDSAAEEAFIERECQSVYVWELRIYNGLRWIDIVWVYIGLEREGRGGFLLF